MIAEILIDFDNYSDKIVLHFNVTSIPQYVYVLKDTINSQLQDKSDYFKLPNMHLTQFPSDLFHKAYWIKNACMSFNKFTTIPSSIELGNLMIDNNKLLSPFVVPSLITSISICSNNIKVIKLQNDNSNKELVCSSNALTSIIGNLSKIKKLVCSNNNLMELVLDDARLMTYLNCGNNKIHSINIPLNLIYFNAYSNKLEGTMDLRKHKKMLFVNIVGNCLTNFYPPPCAKTIECSSNQLKYLRVGDYMENLLCSNNQLDTLYIHTKTKNIISSYNPLRKIVIREQEKKNISHLSIDLNESHVKIVTPIRFLSTILASYYKSNTLDNKTKHGPEMVINSSAYCVQMWWKKNMYPLFSDDGSNLKISI